MNYNKVILLGFVGKEPEVTYFARNHATAYLSLATTERGYTLDDGSQIAERTDWHRVAVHSFPLVQYTEQFIHKGSLILVEGKLRNRQFVKDGVRHYLSEVEADRVMIQPTNPS